MSPEPPVAHGALHLELPDLRPFSPTLIHYAPSPLNTLLVLLSLTPIFIFVAYLTLLVFGRRLSVLLLAGGQLANEALSLGAKRLLKGDRPYKGHEAVGTGYGMPSSHAQAGGYVLAWAVGYYFSRGTRYPPIRGVSVPAGVERVRTVREAVWLAGVGLWSVLVAYSRFVPILPGSMIKQLLGVRVRARADLSRWHLHYHTPLQILAGYALGLAFGAAWYIATEHLPLYAPQSLAGRCRRAIEWVWESVGGVGGWQLGAAEGGWGEGRLFVPELRGQLGHKTQKVS